MILKGPFVIFISPVMEPVILRGSFVIFITLVMGPVILKEPFVILVPSDACLKISKKKKNVSKSSTFEIAYSRLNCLLWKKVSAEFHLMEIKQIKCPN